MGYLKQGGCMAIWGTVGNDATFREFDSGKSVSNFGVRYTTADGDEPGRKKGVYMNVSAWNELSHYASGLEKGDTVLVVGFTQKDEYQSKKQGKEVLILVAELVLHQPTVDYSGGEADSAEEEGEPKSRFSDMGDEEGGKLPF